MTREKKNKKKLKPRKERVVRLVEIYHRTQREVPSDLVRRREYLAKMSAHAIVRELLTWVSSFALWLIVTLDVDSGTEYIADWRHCSKCTVNVKQDIFVETFLHRACIAMDH